MGTMENHFVLFFGERDKTKDAGRNLPMATLPTDLLKQ
jgi:hypothetical protein